MISLIRQMGKLRLAETKWSVQGPPRKWLSWARNAKLTFFPSVCLPYWRPGSAVRSCRPGCEWKLPRAAQERTLASDYHTLQSL